MNKKIKIAFFVVLLIGVIATLILFIQTADIAVLNPKGMVAARQRELILLALGLSAIVVIPVFVMLGVFAWKYRETNHKATYRPNWDSSKLLETIWWGIPCVIILILATVTWYTSHELDPFKALASTAKPLKVQVVALQWKWLFIYPDYKVASVNVLPLPKDTPIDFDITSDAPMNAFWIPHLGSQVYAMSGMSMQLHLMANEEGDYKGSSSNISGKGFADMAFTARVMNREGFNNWVYDVKKSAEGLDQVAYNELAKPSSVKNPTTFVLKKPDLYDSIIQKYTAPADKMNHEAHQIMDMPGMEGM